MDELENTLAAVASGELSPESAAGRLKRGEVRYLDEFAALDIGRSVRKGVPEVVYARGKSPAQVALRWHLQHAATVTIPRSSNAARIEQNFEVFDFELSDDELARIDSLERGERQLDPPWAPDWD
jgi:diketogulonate reductase-like aldo/keto reductase